MKPSIIYKRCGTLTYTTICIMWKHYSVEGNLRLFSIPIQDVWYTDVTSLSKTRSGKFCPRLDDRRTDASCNTRNRGVFVASLAWSSLTRAQLEWLTKLCHSNRHADLKKLFTTDCTKQNYAAGTQGHPSPRRGWETFQYRHHHDNVDRHARGNRWFKSGNNLSINVLPQCLFIVTPSSSASFGLSLAEGQKQNLMCR